MLTARDIDHVFESLRKGIVPERGMDAFAVGVERQREEIQRQLDLAAADTGSIKFLRGGYGGGKTFMARLAVHDAQSRGFATSFVVVSDNDLHFHRFDDVYRKVMTELATSACPRGALGDVLDRWIGRIEEALIATGERDDAPDFDAKVRRRLDDDLMAMTGGHAPQDFIRVIQAIFDLKQQGDVAEAGALVSWLCGSGNVGATAKRAAGIKGDISSRDALAYLRGVLAIVKAAGYRGLVIVIDEAETILRMRKDSRHKSLNGIRQIADASTDYPGLLWLFTGTPDFFDSRHGVAGLPPLDDRIRFLRQGRFASLRQPQLELVPFDADRLRRVALKLREMFPSADRSRLERLVSTDYIEALVRKVTTGFKGDVGVVPRQFLREFVNVMDLVQQEPEFTPWDNVEEAYTPPASLSPEEQQAMRGAPMPVAPDDADDALIANEDVW